MSTATVSYETCPTSAPFFGFMGVTAALCFANVGAAYGTAKSGVGISSMGVMNLGLVVFSDCSCLIIRLLSRSRPLPRRCVLLLLRHLLLDLSDG